jgi:hypothetical protein
MHDRAQISTWHRLPWCVTAELIKMVEYLYAISYSHSSLSNLIPTSIFTQSYSNIHIYTILFQLSSLYGLILTSIFKQSYLNIHLYMISFQHLFLCSHISSFIFLISSFIFMQSYLFTLSDSFIYCYTVLFQYSSLQLHPNIHLYIISFQHSSLCSFILPSIFLISLFIFT